ncbi:L-fucose/L-arabinose isomerase family protein [Blastopirellula sp. JC732]|uniref:L-fucose/L-arabinose isomerase family protein n=1 Tax=Blastopirellula sediminis TaxID=2894196 RepID=A0A9X1SIP8_9BACT|nr:L-fucose/L-arabinose isomerase family protein [Blastopirellula sediminis]MCC9608949.1 L-fucose/L-arabinose isomerase family protein [Blastopirellula sediminis]MCC9628274.1 L-fucose/L-arabinose isomerase family protein [Blastopirellula sediminis]
MPHAQPSVLLVASGDSRLSANQTCWPAQQELEQKLAAAVEKLGRRIERAHPVSADGHGFIDSQKQGMEIFRSLDPDAPLIVAEAVWQYSHHVLAGLISHRGPILTVANWSGQWPGLVGMLNLNGSLTKAGVNYSTLWSVDFTDDYFTSRLKTWLETGKCDHPLDHVAPLDPSWIPEKEETLGKKLAHQLIREKAIMGVFDEGCMGMFNAIIPDHLLHPVGVFKERLSQSALVAEMEEVTDIEANEVFAWYEDNGMRFHFGPDEAQDLTELQVMQQCRMYIAAVRMADHFGCETIGIQYQQGLKDMTPASDLVEGTLNSTARPPVYDRRGQRELFFKRSIPHFNEVDECAGLDAILIQRLHRELGEPVETTLHDLRWGCPDESGTTDQYVWVFEISGSAPAEHLGGWSQCHGYRQPPMYFPKGGSTLAGVSRPGEIVWSRIYVADNALHIDLGRGEAITLPEAETQRRLDSTTPVWPIMHGVTYGVSRDQMMAKHKANHIQVAYASDAASADRAMWARAAMAAALGMQVNLCGTNKEGVRWNGAK